MGQLIPDQYLDQLAATFGGRSTTPEPERDRRVEQQRRQLARLDAIERRRPAPVMPWGIGDPSCDPYA